MKRVLVLGSGFVAAPLVDELLDGPEAPAIDLASLEPERAKRLLRGRPNTRALHLDVEDRDALEELMDGVDLVVSLLPADLHHLAATAALSAETPLVTPSYVSPEIQVLDLEARHKGVLLMCECGLDPGLDHMLAVATARQVEREDGDVVSLISLASGLPATSNPQNPWAYQVSWSPKGMLLAASRPVRWLEDGRVWENESPFDDPGPREMVIGGGVGRLEAFPKQDSVIYREMYGLPRLLDLYRGSLRQPGWIESLRALLQLGYLTDEPEPMAGRTWADLLRHRSPGVGGGLRTRLARQLDVPEDHSVIGRLVWLGLLDDDPLPSELGREASPIDALAWRMRERMGYGRGQRDLVALEQRAIAEDAHDSTRHRIVTRLVAEGEAGDYSAMARIVGQTVAAVARRMLAGEVEGSGVQRPVDPALAEAVLADLAGRGVTIESHVERPAAAVAH
jgi:saccharopine dehydrogenase-like NADP-dependent oxidoreductase